MVRALGVLRGQAGAHVQRRDAAQQPAQLCEQCAPFGCAALSSQSVEIPIGWPIKGARKTEM